MPQHQEGVNPGTIGVIFKNGDWWFVKSDGTHHSGAAPIAGYIKAVESGLDANGWRGMCEFAWQEIRRRYYRQAWNLLKRI